MGGNDYSKDLFRAALWQGKARVASVEKEFDRLMKIIQEHRASEIDVKRCAYEKYPDLKYRPETSQELEARDPLVVAKLLVEMRQRIENDMVEKCVKDPSLLAGFVVKCGVQTLDFSLLGEVEEFKAPKKQKEA